MSEVPVLTLFVAPVAERVGLTSVALGLVRALQRDRFSVGYLKPAAAEAPDPSVLHARLLLGEDVPPPLDSAPLDIGRFEADPHGEAAEALLEEAVRLAARAGRGRDVLVVEGVALGGPGTRAASLNAALCRALGGEAVLVASLAGGPDGVAERLAAVARDFARGDFGVAGAVLNFAPPSAPLPELPAGTPPLLGAVPDEPTLREPRTLDVARALGARVVNAGAWRERRVARTLVAARSAPKVAERLAPGVLVVAPGDRDDIVMAASLAEAAGTPLAGLLLTHGDRPDPAVARLCARALRGDLPVLSVETNSFDTARRLDRLDARVPPDDRARLERAVDFVADHLDTAPLRPRTTRADAAPLSPAAFRHRLARRAREAHARIVLPEGDEPRTVRAAAICHARGLARPVLLGAPDAVRAVAEAQGLTLPPDLEIVDPEAVRARYVAPLVELRRHKGLTAPVAERQLEDTVVLGTVMLALGEVDGLVSGAVHTTANTVRPALQLVKTAEGAPLVSSVFFMLLPDEVLVYGDCAVNPDPTAEELADIAVRSADTARAFGVEPRVALLSYSTGTSGAGEDVEKVAEATRLARARRPDLPIDGPLQYDAATVPGVGAQKAPDSPVAGRANVLIFPDLNTGNTTYKAVQRSAHVVSVGPVLQGLRRPVNDLSRGASVEDIVHTVAVTAVQAASVASDRPAPRTETPA